jgi:hypothetical protein
VLDAVGNEIERRDSKGALSLHTYDVLNRTIRLWARDGAGQLSTLREHLIYGDSSDAGLTVAQAQTANLLGRIYRHYDEAGLPTHEAYDFKGNLLEKVRQVINDASILSVFPPPPPTWQVQAFRVNWQPSVGSTLDLHPNSFLDAGAYRTSIRYDALNRVKVMRYPQDIEETRKELRPQYNRAGALEKVALEGATYVEHLAYNAKGQRVLIVYGNGVMTRYAYGTETFRLARIRTERYTTPAVLTYRPSGAPLQDCAYEYDLAGNIIGLKDRTPASGIPGTPSGTNALDRAFTYDPLYRLLSASGRECDIPPLPPWIDQPRCIDLTRTRPYMEQYQYDAVGNLSQLRHEHYQSDGSIAAFNRNGTLSPNNNRLATLSVGTTSYAYVSDSNGNLIQENASRHYEWDHADRMRVFRTQAGNSEPSVHAHYLYDATGQRVKKLVRKQGGQVEVTVYIDGIFEYQRIVQGAIAEENNSLHVVDNQKRIVMVRVGNLFSGDATPAIKYHLEDHLGSSSLVLDNTGTWIKS